MMSKGLKHYLCFRELEAELFNASENNLVRGQLVTWEWFPRVKSGTSGPQNQKNQKIKKTRM